MAILKKKKEQYREDLEEARDRIKKIEEEMAKELEQARKRLRKLLDEKKAMRKIYDGLALLLDVENEFKQTDKEDGQIQTADLTGGESDTKKT